MAEPINRKGDDGDEAEDKCLKPSCSRAMHPVMEDLETLSRKEKRKAIKKIKRKQMRREMALKWREEEEAKLNDPEEQRRIELMEREEAERIERERKEFEDRERALSEALEKKRLEQERMKALEESKQQQEVTNGDDGKDENDEWEYIEEGPAEIIWQGNEITVKKKRIRVPKKDLELPRLPKEDADRPTSNPLPPESEAFAEYTKSPILSAQQVLENVSQQVPNFGTEQDKAHCPFHLKTGTCRFGQRCSRVHFYPDRSCTILIKNMYSGPGLAWEQDEGLEHTEEEVERCYEEFYEDVHTEFLKYGEIMNFKVCRNGSSHLRGNVYIHYKSLESAMAAYHSANGRFFAGKQVTCEYVSVTKWRVAICGEYMKSRYKACSRGVACNFIHCFRNPGGDYEWADWDKPPPRYWVKEMTALFGYHSEDGIEGQNERGSSRSSYRTTPDLNSKRKWERRSESRGRDDDDKERIRRRHDKGDPKSEEKSVSNHAQMHHRHNEQSVKHGSDDGRKDDGYRQRRGRSRSIETSSSSSKRRKTSKEHRKRYDDYGGDDGDFSDKEEDGGERRSKSKRSWKHKNNKYSKREVEYSGKEGGGWDRRSCDSDDWVERDRDGEEDSKYRRDRERRRKRRSNRTETIEDRWEPQGTESVE